MLQLDAESQSPRGVDQGIGGVRRRKLLEQQFGIERDAIDGAQTAHGPNKLGWFKLPSGNRFPILPPGRGHALDSRKHAWRHIRIYMCHLQNSSCRAEFFGLDAKVGDVSCKLWHAAAAETDINTPVK